MAGRAQRAPEPNAVEQDVILGLPGQDRQSDREVPARTFHGDAHQPPGRVVAAYRGQFRDVRRARSRGDFLRGRDPHRHAVGIHRARQPRFAEAIGKRSLNGEFH